MVLSHVTASQESLWTRRTRHWFLPSMSHEVASQNKVPSKPFVAHAALVRFFSSVRAKMILQRNFLTELLGTLSAFKWLFSGMEEQMSLQSTSLREPLVTEGTLVGPLSGMGSGVLLAIALVGKRLRAVRALERLLSCMITQVR